MPTSATAAEPTLVAAEEFLEIVYADDDLVRAEFDAIVAAEWSAPPPDEPAGDDAVAPAPGWLRPRLTGPNGPGGLADRSRRPGIERWLRQRSPPLGHSQVLR